MKFTARVKTEEGEWIDMPIRVILLDKQGEPEVVIGSSGCSIANLSWRCRGNEWEKRTLC